MRIVVSGASGFVGSALVPYLKSEQHEVYRLVRSSNPSEHDVKWNPYQESVDELVSTLDEVQPDAFIHLSGESILGVWTEHKKRAIIDSRVIPTKYLANTISKMKHPPSIFIAASGIGFYGPDTHGIAVDESAPPGGNRSHVCQLTEQSTASGFLTTVSKLWEESAESIKHVVNNGKPVRVVHLRIGSVLDPSGSMLGSMLTPFKLCLGGVLGDGSQWQSWISLFDLIRAISFILTNEKLEGPVNLVSTNPVTNYDFTSSGKVLWRPTICWVPEFVLRASSIVLGDLVSDAALSSIKVQPKKLLDAGFRFTDAELEPGLRRMLHLN